MDILSLCDQCPATVPVTASAAEAISAMLDRNVGAVAVLDEQRVVAGIFSERDVLNKMALDERRAVQIPVNEVMTTPVVMATREITPAEALGVMVESHHRHLPIVDENGQLLGMLSIRNVLQARIDGLAAQLAAVKQ